MYHFIQGIEDLHCFVIDWRHSVYQSSGNGSTFCVTGGCCSGISLPALGWCCLLLCSWCIGDLLWKACLWERREGASLCPNSLSLRDSLDCS